MFSCYAMHPPPPKRRRVNPPIPQTVSQSKPTKKLIQLAVAPPPDLDEELFSKRAESQIRLKAAWEGIFAKYERDTSDFADEIDLETGEIVVDKGHLRGLCGKEVVELEEDLWSTWVEGEACTEKQEVKKGTKASKGSGNGGKLNTSPKVFLLAGTVYSFDDCELCADRDELDFTPCTHIGTAGKLSWKENTHKLLTPKLAPPIAIGKKNHLLQAQQPQPSEIDFEADDELSASTPAGPKLPTHLTPALDTLSLVPRTASPFVLKQPQLPPSSPIVRHVSRKDTQTRHSCPHSSPIAPSSLPPLVFSSPSQRTKNIWAPLDDDPLVDKTWHSHHPDGSPPRPKKGTMLPPRLQQENSFSMFSSCEEDSSPLPLGKNLSKNISKGKKKKEKNKPLVLVGQAATTQNVERVDTIDKCHLDISIKVFNKPTSHTTHRMAPPPKVSTPLAKKQQITSGSNIKPGLTPISGPLIRTPAKLLSTSKSPYRTRSKVKTPAKLTASSTILWSSEFRNKNHRRVKNVTAEAPPYYDQKGVHNDRNSNSLHLLECFTQSSPAAPRYLTQDTPIKSEPYQSESLQIGLIKAERVHNLDTEATFALFNTGAEGETRHEQQEQQQQQQQENQEEGEEGDNVMLHSKQHFLSGNTPESLHVAVPSPVNPKEMTLRYRQRGTPSKSTPPLKPPCKTPVDIISNKTAVFPLEMAKDSPSCGTKGHTCQKAVCWACIDAGEDLDLD